VCGLKIFTTPPFLRLETFEQGDVTAMTPGDMVLTDGKQAAGGFLTGQHVKNYFRPYVECSAEIPYAPKVVDGSFNKTLYVFVSKQAPMFLGRCRQRLVLDTCQINFLSGLRSGGCTEARGSNVELASLEALDIMEDVEQDLSVGGHKRRR
jgi:hypothetical protein